MGELKLGSLFDGIATFPLSGSEYGFTPVWASEIEPFPIRVTRTHFPDMKHLGDINEVNGAEIEPVDVITGGFPCQDVSVAGKREGLAGEQSGLFFEAIRVIKEMQDATNGKYPQFIVMENVPGLLSSNGGEDMRVVLDTLQDLGFVIDVNIFDAQHMGVPQRRRRVFLVCQSVETILQMRTISSAKIIIQLLIECLLIRWVELLRVLGKEPKNLDLRTKNLAGGGLHKRMKLFSMHKEEHLNLLLTNLAEMLVRYQKEQEHLELMHGQRLATKESIEDTLSPIPPEKVKTILASDLFTLLLWKNILVEGLPQKKESIISTEIRETTESKIYYCAKILLNIAEYTLLLKPLCQNFSEWESLLLTGIKECMSYARQTSSDLFTDMEWVYRWNDYFRRASDCREQIERYIRGQRRPEVFPQQEGLRGYPAESRKAREEAAASIGDGIKESGTIESFLFENHSQDTRYKGPLDVAQPVTATYGMGGNNQPFVVHKKINCTPEGITGAVSSKWAKGTGGPAGDEHYNLVVLADQGGQQMDVLDNKAPTLRAEEHGHQPIVIGFRGKAGAKAGSVGAANNLAPTLLAEQESHVATFQPIPIHDKATRYKGGGSTRKDDGAANGFGVGKPGDVMPTLGTGDRHAVAAGYAVRRLTPLECERLQGLPDGWTDIPPQAEVTAQDLAFWRIVWDKWDDINGKKPHSDNQIKSWLRSDVADTARYKAIGNGIAKPCSDFVMGGIARVLRRNLFCD